nr:MULTISPECIES: DUF5134 domain-containing protein [unclassified Microbacterium]
MTSPWDLILTALFAATGLWCAIDLAAHRGQARRADGSLTEHTVIHVNHLVMSIAMILMVWVPMIDAANWAQVAIFAIFAAALTPALATGGVANRVSALGHITMNAAMIWMVLAMPLLMAGMIVGGDESSAHHHHGGDDSGLPTSTPVWADVVNGIFVIVSALAALWWILALLRRNRHWHDLCYAAMSAGMGIMLVLMNV